MTPPHTRLAQTLDDIASRESPPSELFLSSPNDAVYAKLLRKLLRATRGTLRRAGAHHHLVACIPPSTPHRLRAAFGAQHVLLIRWLAQLVYERLPAEVRVHIYQCVLGARSVVPVAGASSSLEHGDLYPTGHQTWRPRRLAWADRMVEPMIVGTPFFTEFIAEWYRHHTHLIPAVGDLDNFLDHDTWSCQLPSGRHTQHLVILLDKAATANVREGKWRHMPLARLQTMRFTPRRIDIVVADGDPRGRRRPLEWTERLHQYQTRGYTQGDETPPRLAILQRDGDALKSQLRTAWNARVSNECCVAVATTFPPTLDAKGVSSALLAAYGASGILYYESLDDYDEREGGQARHRRLADTIDGRA